jgi:hypothetical protein
MRARDRRPIDARGIDRAVDRGRSRARVRRARERAMGDEARAMTDGDFLSRAVRVRAQMNISAKVRAARECVATARCDRWWGLG